jgi:hypothetical protein
MAALATFPSVEVGAAPLDRDTANLRWAGDRNRLLPGERPQTLYSEDAHHWVRVYTDLLAFNLEMMDLIDKRLVTAPAPDDAPERADLALLQAHVRRLRWRLGFWQRRRSQLNQLQTATRDQPPLTSAVP